MPENGPNQTSVWALQGWNPNADSSPGVEGGLTAALPDQPASPSKDARFLSKRWGPRHAVHIATQDLELFLLGRMSEAETEVVSVHIVSFR
jgi:hypothetical protein